MTFYDSLFNQTTQKWVKWPFFNFLKFVDQSTGFVTALQGNQGANSKINFPVIRYAEVLLLYAEALNELNGPAAESIDLINQVKGRSHAKLLSLADYNQSTLRDAILQERGWEFFYEGKRREDLIRMDKYDVLTNAYLTRIGQTPSIVMPKNQYFPYPLSQVQLNPNLSNAGRE